jgi:dipeptidyl aminopeptidase/acylaminoacyl peptidase
MSKTVAPYGVWRSPVTTELLTAGSIGLSQLWPDGDDLYWIEARPSEAGRNTIVRRRADGVIEDVLPAPWSARSRVHEYGGGAYTAAAGVVYFCNDADQQVYGFKPGESRRALTQSPTARFADLLFDPFRRQLLAVREEHTAGGEPVNTLVAIATDGSGHLVTLAHGEDFYSSPALSPDGKRLAWLSWRHPNMPWDETRCWCADIDAAGALANVQAVAGGDAVSIFQPQFGPDGALYFVSDQTGWWNLYRWYAGASEPLWLQDAEFGVPQWVFGLSTYAFLTPSEIVCTYAERGQWRLGRLDLNRRQLEPIATEFTEIGYVRALHGVPVCVAGSPTQVSAVVQIDLVRQRAHTLRASASVALAAGDIARGEAIDFETAAGARAFGFFYPPTNATHAAPAGERPPLLVISHGGPTAASGNALNLRIQFWTSRGLAVLDVNYRGSTGYGRAYRRALDGLWGIADVADCVAGARALVQQGRVDGQRLAIRGSSAGGYTTLCALTFHDAFRAGASYYGISDLEALTRDTHKFEARYLDRLVGPYPQELDQYRARSPIHYTALLKVPMILLQGLQDKVVPPNQSERLVAALRAKQLPVAYVTFEHEAHGFRRAESIQQALEAELYFYSRVFGFTPTDALVPMPIENL